MTDPLDDPSAAKSADAASQSERGPERTPERDRERDRARFQAERAEQQAARAATGQSGVPTADDKTAAALKKRAEETADFVKTIVYALLIAVFVRTFAYEPFNIPSGSMIPTLLVGDYLFVSKFSYGYSQYSLPFGLIPFEGRILDSEPERGDVAVFRLPADPKVDYIKRIVGLPGDRIQMKLGVLHINGEPVSRLRIDDFRFGEGASGARSVRRYEETLPGGVSHAIIELSGDTGLMDNTPEYTVPDGHYFALGDNRDGSQDSRFLDLVGYIPAKNLIGRAEFLFFSVDGAKTEWYEVWNWPSAIRFGRIFNGVR
ncbi:MAG: signal peptidase I [Alphaproteobacteria bacterium]|nr:signal peptidase I [Alphaproteobacteria bacterium]